MNKNMKNMYGELMGTVGYLHSRDVRMPVVLKSWKPEDTNDFEKYFNVIKINPASFKYSTKFKKGLVNQSTDCDGNVVSRLCEFEGTDEDEENVRELKVQGYKDWYNVNSYFKSLTDDCSKELFGDYKIAKKR